MYKTLIRPLLFRFCNDPEDAHRLVMSLLRTGSRLPLALRFISALLRTHDDRLAQTVFGLRFPTPLGLAAGFDKHSEALPALAALGFGHLEIGTVTEHAQPGNPRPRMFRLPLDQALINRMGFNNQGAEALVKALQTFPPLVIPIGVSLGKSKITPLEDAAEDYLFSFRTLYDRADYFAINVSSPNTPGLRTLQDSSALEQIVGALTEENKEITLTAKAVQPKPLLVKIAPDLTFEVIDEVLAVCSKYAVNGIIATNTTIARDHLKTNIDEAGGLSGAPLRERALAIVRHIHKQAPALPIIGVGGIFTAEHAYALIKAGASLIQAYTGFIYEGPAFARNINRGLLKLLERDGFSSISEAVGKEAV